MSKKYDSLIDQFTSITGTGKALARSLLEACHGNLEMALDMHMDAAGTSASPSADNFANSEDDIRAPIPQKHETLVEEPRAFGFRRQKRKTTTSVFDGFRDFQAEIKQQESAGESTADKARNSKYRRLEDLFRPPIDLLFKGGFHSAKDAGSQQNKWLMVNVQNTQEFPCQMLNRDVWSNHTVRDIIRKNFLLWQVYNDSEEGQKFIQFYPVAQWPYIAILDPRTGEKMVEWNKMDAVSFCDLVGDFLAGHPNPNGVLSPSSPPPAKRAKREDNIVDSSEDQQLKAALTASMRETSASTSSSAGASSPRTSGGAGAQRVGTSEARRQILEEGESDDGCGSASEEDEEELSTFSGTDDDDDIDDVKPHHTKKSQSPKLDKQVASLLESSMTSSALTNQIAEKCTNSSSSSDILHTEKEEKKPEAAMTESTSQAEVEKDKWREFLGDENDEKSKILLKMPCGKREQISLPCSSQLRALVEFIHEKGFHPDKYELLTNYPRRNISQLAQHTTLRDAGLFPQETVFVHER